MLWCERVSCTKDGPHQMHMQTLVCIMLHYSASLTAGSLQQAKPFESCFELTLRERVI